MPGDVSQIIFALGRVEPTGLHLLGTGFGLGPTKLATAYHVVGADDRNLAVVVPRVRTLFDYQDTADLAVRTVPVAMVAVDPIRDLCVLELAPGNEMVVPYSVASTDSVPPGAPVFTFGFPHANFGRMVLTQQMAQVGARVLIDSAGQKNKHIVLNTQARDGQSGGPVFNGTLSSVVAVLLGSYVLTDRTSFRSPPR